ncbi:MAG: Smr/MutS family protein [Spirochaetia bacterium]|nr:Smr/MutS family protein [Spirochaetia bacterium]
MNNLKSIYIRKMRFTEAKLHFRNELEKCFYFGDRFVEVIHGIGTYTLRNMVIDEVGKLDYVSIIESYNPGSLILELDVPEQSFLNKLK